MDIKYLDPSGLAKLKEIFAFKKHTHNDIASPTYTDSTTLAKLSSGEKLSVAFGKISKAITDLIAHIGNKSNPHSVTKSQLGLENVGNFKAISTVINQGLTDAEKKNARTNIGLDSAIISGSQTTMSTADGGSNVYTFTDVSGNTSSIIIKNGSKGATGSKGSTGEQGYSIVASIERNNFNESNWTTYGTIGHVEPWNNTEEIRNGCRVGDLFMVVGTSTDGGKAHILIYRSNTASGKLSGSCIAHVAAEKGATGEPGKNATTTAVVNKTANGLVPKLPNETTTTKYLRQDGIWAVPPDTNTTYNAAGESLGLVKTGGDVTITSGVITIKDDSHNHTITNVDGLQTTLDGKASLVHKHNANSITDGYLNTHPENNGVLIPFINNDIAYLLKRGGSAIVKYDNIVQSVDISNVFDPAPTYLTIKHSNITNITIELTLHKTFTWSNTIYVDHGSNSWRAKNIKIEVINTDFTNDVWTVKGNVTNYSTGQYAVKFSHKPVGASDAGAGFNKIRFTFSDWTSSTIFRIACLGVYNCVSNGLMETFLPKGGGELYGGITPFTNNTISLGSSSKKWNSVYATIFNGALSGNAATATALTTSAGSAIKPVYFSGGKPVACTYTIEKSVPSNAVFTDTKYTHPTTSGNKHIPSGGSSGQILQWFADGTAVWRDLESETITDAEIDNLFTTA